MSQPKTKKKLISSLAFIIAPIMSAALFTFMGILIFQSQDLSKKKSEQVNISFLSNYKEKEVENIDRKKPKKPKDPMKAPEAPKVSVSKPKEQKLKKLESFKQSFDTSSLASGMAVGGYGGSGGSGDRGVVPLIRMRCEAPRRARMEGITGRVTLKYDINTKGQTENVEVLSSKPSRVFDENCIQAVLQWRFKPKMVDGEAVAVRGNITTQVMSYGGQN